MSTGRLSKDDIDRLLGTNKGGGAAAGANANLYDFRRPNRVSKERLRILEAMYERLGKSLEAWLIPRVRRQVEVRLQSFTQFAFREFTLSLPEPCSSFTFDILGTGQKGAIDIGAECSTFIIDRVFGGEGSAISLTRALTPIERMAVRSVADKIAGLLQEVWQDHCPMECTISGYESSPEMLQVVNREDPVLVANMEFTTGNISSMLLICLPAAVLDKFFTSSLQQRSAMLSTSEEERDATRQHSEATLRATRVPITARLPDFRISMRDLALVQEGVIIPTGIPKDSRILVQASTQERFIGHPGRVNGSLAVRILDAVPSFDTLTS